MREKNSEFVPVWEYCKINGVTKQNIYRWIREGKIDQEHLKTEERVVKRITIHRDAKPE